MTELFSFLQSSDENKAFFFVALVVVCITAYEVVAAVALAFSKRK